MKDISLMQFGSVEVFANADPTVLTIYSAWVELEIPAVTAKNYHRQYNNVHGGAAGFIETEDGRILLRHGGGRITLTEQERDCLREIIETAIREMGW